MAVLVGNVLHKCKETNHTPGVHQFQTFFMIFTDYGFVNHVCRYNYFKSNYDKTPEFNHIYI